MGGRLFLTVFKNEAYTAGLYLSHLRRYTLTCCTLRIKLHWFDLLWICCKFICETCLQQTEPVEFEPRRARMC